MAKRYYIILAILALLFILVNANTPNSVSWLATYKMKDKNPYGAEVTYAFLEDIFGKDNVIHNNASPYEYLHDNLNAFNVIYLASAVKTSDVDQDAILEFLDRGNNVFIAAQEFSGPLADTLGLSNTGYHMFPADAADSVTLSFTNRNFNNKDYSFQYDHLFNYILPDTTLEMDYTILSQSSDYQPHFIKVSYGSGNLYYHSNPLIFTNFNMLHESEQYEYISNCFSYLPKTKTLWSEYYSAGGSQESSTELRFILKNPQLRWAYYILLSFVGIFILFQSKRRQRAIPIVTPPRNSTLEFVETTGRLYFQQKNHANLANKKIQFFLEKIRTKYYINTSVLDESFVDSVASKSGVSQEDIRQLIKMFDFIKKAEKITESQLLDLNKKIESFYTKASL